MYCTTNRMEKNADLIKMSIKDIKDKFDKKFFLLENCSRRAKVVF